MEYLALKTPGGKVIDAPAGIPTGGITELADINTNFVTILLVVASLFALIMAIWGGIKWISSEGDKSKVQSARNTVIFALIGLVVVFLSFFFINFTSSLFGVKK